MKIAAKARQARQETCPQCRAGVGERCLDLRPGYRGLRIKGLHQARKDKVKASA